MPASAARWRSPGLHRCRSFRALPSLSEMSPCCRPRAGRRRRSRPCRRSKSKSASGRSCCASRRWDGSRSTGRRSSSASTPRVAATGRSSPSARRRPQRPVPPPRPAPDGSARTAAAAQRIAGGSVRIVDATLRYRDERSGEQYEISALNLELAADDREGPVAVEGTLSWRGVKLRISGTASPLRTILAGQPVELSLKVSGTPVEAAYAGSLTLKGGIDLGRQDQPQGCLRPRPRGLARHRLDGGRRRRRARGVGPDDIGGRPGDALLHRGVARRRHGGRLPGARPQGTAQAQRQAAALRAGPGRSAGTSRPAAGCAGRAASPPPGRRRSAPKDGARRPSIRSCFGLADAELALSVGRLVYKDVKTGPGTLSLSVDAGVAKAAVEAVEALRRQRQGQPDARRQRSGPGASRPTSSWSASPIEPLLADAADVAWLGGRGTVALTLSGRGLSERQIVESARRQGRRGGGRRGAQRHRHRQDRPRDPARAAAEPQAGARRAHVLQRADGKLRHRQGHRQEQGPEARQRASAAQGRGSVELGPRRIDYTLHAKIGGGAPAEGAVIKIGTIEVPVGIKGPLQAPTFTRHGAAKRSATP